MSGPVRLEAGIELYAEACPDEPAETWDRLRAALEEGYRSIDQRRKEYGPLEPDRFDLREANARLSQLRPYARLQP